MATRKCKGLLVHDVTFLPLINRDAASDSLHGITGDRDSSTLRIVNMGRCQKESHNNEKRSSLHSNSGLELDIRNSKKVMGIDYKACELQDSASSNINFTVHEIPDNLKGYTRG
ncbi:unnamed protein product [Dovyalis caffra]|uniref:Uncharacterized protein n=1 Tax=Dovyalis caffra TaxID=77055 RepID=A0AAV1SK61_9ROSI|nr:unnamed protein product [Dovyalis caffra]